MTGGLTQGVLAQRARDYITKNNIQLIGITGSWGLPIAKHVLRVLLADYVTLRVGRAGASKNQQVLADILGVPRGGLLGMLGISRIHELFDDEPQVIITEVPLRSPGDIEWLAGELPFGIAGVVNVHSSYMELFNRRELLAHELLSLPASLSAGGTAVLNIDDTLLATFTDNITAKALGFGQTPAAEVEIVRMDVAPLAGARIAIKVGSKQLEGKFPHVHTTGQASVYVAGFALWYAATNSTGNVEEAFREFREVAPPHGYGSLHSIDGVQVYNDSGNATPESIMDGLYAMSQVHGRVIAILGDIVHLGAQNEMWHKKIGEEAAQTADIFIGVGENMRIAQTAALQHESPVDTHHFDSAKNAGKWLHGYLRKGDTVYLAGSASMKMDHILKRLQRGM